MMTQELRQNLGSVSAVLLLLLGYSLSKDKDATTLALALLVLCSLLAGVLIKVVCQRCEAFELQDRVSQACLTLAQSSSGLDSDSTGGAETPLRQPGDPCVGLQRGSALASVVSVYRNGVWQRVPKLLLVEGDVVALMGGDRAPCTAQVLRFKVEEEITGTPTKADFGSGRVNPEVLQWVFHETGTKCYRLLETPLEAHLKLSLSPAGTNGRTSLIRQRVRAAGRRCYSAVLIVAFLAAAVGGIRLALVDDSRDNWALYMLIIPSQVAVCLLPMSLPIYLAAGEAVATARLLAFLELMLRRKREANRVAGTSSSTTEELDEYDQMDAEEREEATSGTSHTVSWKKAWAYLCAVIKARWLCGTRNRVRQRLPPFEPERTVGGFTSKQALPFGWWENSHRSKECCENGAGEEGIQKLTEVVQNCDTTEAYGSTPAAKKASRKGRTLLPVPMLRCGLVERLGAVTTLCMLDEDTVCKPTADIKEVFLVDSKDDAGRGSGTVLDMHTQQGNKGVRFEDPHWWTHLPVLKPIGLTCLLAETKHSEVCLQDSNVPRLYPYLQLPFHPLAYQRQQGKSKSVCNPVSHVDPLPSSKRFHSQNRPDGALLDHVRDNQPMEHLTDLWKAIGFCAADRAVFRERRRIHVIDPKLAAARATEDTHAQGQDESRRRGTLQPHLTCIMAEDRRSRSLQLLGQGNPSIVLGMCRDYWDGSAISNLPATLRKSILGMYQQWDLEDLDVIAFAYTPVPYTVNPFLSSFSKHPDYLIHTSQGSSKGRPRGVGLSPVPKRPLGTTHVPVRERNYSDLSRCHQGSNLEGSKGGARPEESDAASNAVPNGRGAAILSSEGKGGVNEQAAGRQSVSANSSPVGSPGKAVQDPKFEVAEPGNGFVVALQASSTSRVLTRGASEGCLHQASAQALPLGIGTNSAFSKVPTEDGTGQGEGESAAFQGSPKHPPNAVLENSVLESQRVWGGSDSRRKKGGKFRPRTSESFLRRVGSEQDPLGRRFATYRNRPSLRQMTISKKGGRRYSMDDYGVNIAHRAELQTSQETIMPASGESKMAEALWNLMHEQVFLGMAASFVPPKRDIVALIEDVEAAGVRFVYFSPRNMRRSKALAESMGIETDWNCAISLRPLEDSSQPDPHRMTSTYADWDVKARLPHGIAAIRDHIERVDNVPLLVSLFTDATPPTTKDMLGIYQEYDESVLAVGMSHRAVNADLFRAADLSFSVEGLPLDQPLSSLPLACTSRFSAIDAAFNNSVVGLHTALPLGDVVLIGGAIGGLEGVGSIIIDLIREGRRLLTNSYQALSFVLLGSFAVALLVLFAGVVPISNPMILGGDHLIWILWLVAPLLATSFLASPADGSLMKRTPEKNNPKVVPIAAQLVVHLLLRTIPTVLVCIGLYVVLYGEFLLIDNAELALSCGSEDAEAPTSWMDMVRCNADDGQTRAAAGQAVDLVLVELVLCLIFQSASFMYRTASIRKESPLKNWVWSYSVMLVISLQVLHLWASAAARQTLHLISNCPWEPLVVGVVCPFLVLGISELLKKNDARVYNRYVTLLRLEFDTRLGMHSPR